jgi:hypothetical protein
MRPRQRLRRCASAWPFTVELRGRCRAGDQIPSSVNGRLLCCVVVLPNSLWGCEYLEPWTDKLIGHRERRFDVLFEPVAIGPVTARNRFFQVPHCNGMGYRDVSAQAAMRRVKAEGGWAVVCTEEVGAESTAAADSVVLITARVRNDSLYQQLLVRTNDWYEAGVAVSALPVTPTRPPPSPRRCTRYTNWHASSN